MGGDTLSVTGWANDDGFILWGRDMIVGRVSPTRGLVSYSYKPWSNKTVFYDDSGIRGDPALVAQFEAATKAWTTKTGLAFVTRTNEENYLKLEIETDPGKCGSAEIGMRGGSQVLNLASGCSVDSAIHELGHSLGLLHEHQRWDRDDYVRVDLSGLDTSIPGCSQLEWEGDYAKVLSGAFISGPYDVTSIMHYDSLGSCQKAGATQILLLKSGAALARQTMISDGDACAVWELYDRPRFLAEKCYQASTDCRRAQKPFQWSCAGPIPDKPCIRISNADDPDSWDDNYLCGVAEGPSIKYTENTDLLPDPGALCAWHCANLNEPREESSRSWSDNAICTRVCRAGAEGGVNPCFEFAFSAEGPDPNRTCIQLFEPIDLDGWQDNYLCWSTGCGN